MAAAAVAMVGDSCEAAIAAMALADPDLDPVWGLLVAGEQDISDAEEERNFQEIADTNVKLSSRCELAEANSDNIVAACLDEEEALEKEADCSDRAPETAPRGNVVDKAQVSPVMFPLLEEAESKLSRWDVPGCDAFVLDGVLTPAECDHLISQGEGLWSFWDDTEKPRVEFRNAHTIEVLHADLADRIWRRVHNLVNPSICMSEGDDRFEVDIEGEWQPYAMNPTLLLSRYLNGGHFSPHTDGTTIVDFNRRTFYSCVLFLNSSPWGGETRIYSDEQMRRELKPDGEGRLTGDPSLVLEAVPPRPGRMLVFYHRLMHEGVPAAEKYIIRTDVLYRRTEELCTAPEDVEAFNMYQEAQLLAEKGHCDASVNLFRRAFKRSPALAQIYRM
jgi:leukotriene-A4 hydrolase